MPAGEAFTDRQRNEIARAIRLAEKESGLRFAVHVGALGADSRGQALRLHAQLGAQAARGVLVAVDPGDRRLEIVTGPEAKRQLDDYSCGLGALSMTTQFAMGDLVGGIVNGLLTLGEHARTPRVLHLNEP